MQKALRSAPRQAAPACPVRVEPPKRPLGVWSTYRTARRNILEAIPEPAYHEWILRGGRPDRGWRMIMDPLWLDHVLKRNERNYPRSEVTLRMLKPTEGESLFTAQGRNWRWQRRAMTPVFRHANLAALSPVMTAAAVAASARMEEARGETVDVYPEMVDTAFDVICDTAFSRRERLDRRALEQAVTGYIDTVARMSLMDTLAMPRWVPRPARVLDRHGPAMDRMIDRVLEERLATPAAETGDLLDLMIGATDPKSGRSMTRIELRNNLLIMLVAGHETTALALTWALYLLAFDEGWQARVRDEAQGVLGDRPATAEDLPRLPAVRRVLDEAMRLYPPAGLMTRQAKRPDRIEGRRVGTNTLILIPVWAIHRHRGLWEHPDEFDPDRFLPEAAQGRPRLAYMPFGAGPRICIGMGLALMEAQIVLATLVARHAFALTPQTTPYPEMILTTRPAQGMPLAVRRL